MTLRAIQILVDSNAIKGAKSGTHRVDIQSYSTIMRFTDAFTFAFVFLSITSIASPVSPPTNEMRSVVNRLDVRQSDIAESQ
jgi:hypothetical protein